MTEKVELKPGMVYEVENVDEIPMAFDISSNLNDVLVADMLQRILRLEDQVDELAERLRRLEN